MSGWAGLDALLTAAEVAELLRCPSKRAVGRLRRAGKLPGVQVGREYMFHRDAVDAFMRGGGAWS